MINFLSLFCIGFLLVVIVPILVTSGDTTAVIVGCVTALLIVGYLSYTYWDSRNG